MDYWPHAVFRAPEVRWRLASATIQGGLPTLGPAKTSGTDGGGLWVCEMSGIWLRKREQIKAARALDVILDGGLNKIVVGSCESAFAPWAKRGEPVPHSNGSPFSGATFYAGVSPGGRLIEAAPLRATTLRIALPSGVKLDGGEVISIRHPVHGERRYGIGRIGEDGVVAIRPPLREAVTAGTKVDFISGACVMRLANPSEFFEPIRLSRSSMLNPVFVEAFPDAV